MIEPTQAMLDTKNHYEEYLHTLDNVCGSGIGEKWVNGVPTGEPAILVFVQKKNRSEFAKFSVGAVPPDIDGLPTDVIEVGNIVPQLGFRSKIRPLQPGFSCGHGDTTAGTIGGFFYDRDGDPVILSNNHVLAEENKARIGDVIYQPGPADSRNTNFIGWDQKAAKLNYFATLKNFVAINNGKSNFQDSAIAKIHPKFIEDGMIDPTYPTVNRPLSGFADAVINSSVQKCGRTTGYTTGKVLGKHANFTIQYGVGSIKFDNCIVLSSMSQGGDSGSIIADMNMNAVGLLFAGSSKVTLANPIMPIVDHYGLKLFTQVDHGTLEDFASYSGDGSLTISNNQINIKSAAHNFCYVEKHIAYLDSISCTINTGDDSGATWGPGLTIKWAEGIIKINLRHNKTYGGYFNTNSILNVGKVSPNTDYELRIRRLPNTILGEIKDQDKWISVIEVPNTIFGAEPTAVRFGKTSDLGGAKNFSSPGNIGQCTIRNIKINGYAY